MPYPRHEQDTTIRIEHGTNTTHIYTEDPVLARKLIRKGYPLIVCNTHKGKPAAWKCIIKGKVIGFPNPYKPKRPGRADMDVVRAAKRLGKSRESEDNSTKEG